MLGSPRSAHKEIANGENSNVWHFEMLHTWHSTIQRLLKPHVNKSVIAAFRRKPPKYVVGDDLSWLDDIIYGVRGIDIDIKRYLADRVQEEYKYIRAYHGARPVEIDSYYAHGLKLMDPDALEHQARAIFLSPHFPELAKEAVDQAICKVGRKLREGRVFFEVSRLMLEDHCAHYMLYGSEYVVAIAAALPGSRDYRQVLKSIGRPTVFVCNVPLSALHDEVIEDFAGHAIEVIFERILDPQYEFPEHGRGGGLITHEPLAAECVLEHYHPHRLRDPLLGY